MPNIQSCHKLSSLALLSLFAFFGITACGTPTASSQTQANTDLAHNTQTQTTKTPESKITPKTQCDNSKIAHAFVQQKSDLQVLGCGTVIKTLADDNDGSRHQKFLVALSHVTPKQTILIAHNIDLAPKITELKQGDQVQFYGEYEYNPKGGVVHWTHHDPSARHQNGWIKWQGQTFQ